MPLGWNKGILKTELLLNKQIYKSTRLPNILVKIYIVTTMCKHVYNMDYPEEVHALERVWVGGNSV